MNNLENDLLKLKTKIFKQILSTNVSAIDFINISTDKHLETKGHFFAACHDMYQALICCSDIKFPLTISTGLIGRSIIEYYIWFEYFDKHPKEANEEFSSNSRSQFKKQLKGNPSST